MAKTKIIACEMLRPEVESILADEKPDYEVIWIEAALHVTPDLLHQKLQEIFDGLSESGDCERVLMPFGDCGGAVNRLQTGNFETIIPRVDDCLTLLLGSTKKRLQIAEEAPTFFLSLGWITQKSNIIASYESMAKKYGEDMAKMLTATMYGNYQRVALIDTGVGDYNALLAYEEPLKRIFGFEKYPVKGTTAYLRKLFFGPWPEGEFRIIPPYGRL